MDKTSINKRFIIAVNEILKTRMASKKGEIAATLGISVSTLSEILKGRLNVSTEHAAKLSHFYIISLDWLLLDEEPIFKQEPPRRSKNYNLSVSDKIASESVFTYEETRSLASLKGAIDDLLVEIVKMKERMNQLEAKVDQSGQ